jgi:HK97 gp10 family phage protein
MINVNFGALLGEFRALESRFRELPDNINKKHLLAAMRKSIRDAKGPQLLRKNTPPVNTRRGRKAAGQKRSSGLLRKSVMVKAKWIGRNRDGAAFAGLGYKYGRESLKAIYHEFGTTHMAARKMMERTYNEIRSQVSAKLSSNLAASLDKAVREAASKKNPGMSKRGIAAGL